MKHPLPDAHSLSPSDYKPSIESTPLWKPSDEGSQKIREFLSKVNGILHEREREANGTLDEEPPQAANRPPKSTAFADDEDALFALYTHNYDVDETLNHIPYPPANGPRITGPTIPRPIDADLFEAAFREYGKNFHLIQKNEV